MIKNVTEGLEELRQTEDGFNNAAVLLRLSVKTMFALIGQPGATVLNLYHPDGADINIDLNRITVTATTNGGETHFFGIDGIVSPPSNGNWVVRTDSCQPITPLTPRPSRINRLRESFERFIDVIAHPNGDSTAEPPKLVGERGYHEHSYVGERQILSLFIWIAGAHIVDREADIVV